MKILLFLAKHPGELEQYPPLGLGYLAATLRRHFPDVEFSYCNSIDQINEDNFDLALVSCASTGYRVATRAAGLIGRTRKVPVLIGGVHISTLPESLHPAFSAGVVGEGEQAVVDLVGALVEDGRLEPKRLKNISGLVIHTENGPKLTGRRPLIENLDSLPHPDRALLGYLGGPAHLMSSRGCPYRCTFCSSAAHWREYRTFSVPYLIAEIDELVERFGTTSIHIYDDLFVARKERLQEFARLYRERGYPGKLEVSCAVRANLMDQEVAELLADLGFSRITFGAESASDKVLATLKSSVTVEDNQRAVAVSHAAGLKVGLSFIIGAPDEEKADLISTYLFVFKAIYEGKIDQADVNVLTPFPGTPIWDLAQEQWIVSKDMDWSLLSTPWRGLLLNRNLRTDGLRALLYDLKVRRMLDRWKTPVTGVVMENGRDRLDPNGDLIQEVARSRIFNTLLILQFGGTERETVDSFADLKVVYLNEANLPEFLSHQSAASSFQPMIVPLKNLDLLNELDKLNYLIWTFFEEEPDGLVCAEIPGAAVISGLTARLLANVDWRQADRFFEELGRLPGYDLSEIDYDPDKFAFADDIFPDPLPTERVFAEVVDLYAKISEEKTLFANAQSGLEGKLAAADNRIAELTEQLGRGELANEPNIKNNKSIKKILTLFNR